MKEFVDKLISRLEEEIEQHSRMKKESNSLHKMHYHMGIIDAYNKAIEIVNQVAEEYKSKVMIDGQYCWQTCGATEHCKECNRLGNGYTDYYENYDFMAEEYNNGWIPFTQRELDEEEKEYYGDEIKYMLDCKLPEEDEEILVTYKWKNEFYVGNDTFLRDGSECYLDSGREFITEAIAWMPLPAPYKKEGDK